MTVEQLVDLLEREYPQASVNIEVTVPGGRARWDGFRGCFVLDPYRLRSHSRTGVVSILCDRHDR